MTAVTAPRRPGLDSGARATAAWTIVAAVAVAVLAWNMPPEGFFSGDPGVKLIAAFSALEHPSRPFEVDFPVVGGEPRPWVDRFFQRHGTHAHALQSPLFPVASAPFLALAGLRGAYLLPVLGFVLLVPLVECIRRALVPTVSPHMLGFSAVVASPAFFYALEFWEHVPAIAVLAGVTALLAQSTHERAWVRGAAAGVLGATAVLLRPEAAWYVAALVLTLRPGRHTLAGLMLGGVGILLPFGIANQLHSGTMLGPHAAANMAPLRDAWLATRVSRATLWLWPASPLALVGAGLLALSWGARLVRVSAGSYLVGASGAAMIAVSGALGHLPRESLWTAWPAGALVLVGMGRNRGRRTLMATAGATMLGVLLTSTHDGGAQWGPRFLLIASPALVVLAAAAAQDLVQHTGRMRMIGIVSVIAIALCAAAASRLAYRELRASKRYYARVVHATERLVPDGSYVLTDVWWFDQITAALYRRHTSLVTTDPGTARLAAQSLQAAGVASPVAVTSAEEPMHLLEALAGTCYRVATAERIPERGLTFHRLTCRPAQTPR